MTKNIDDIKKIIRDVNDFPKPGIIFKDITPLLLDPEAFNAVVTMLAEPFKNSGITKVAGMESRGFIFGVPVAAKLNCGFIPVRKPGKLPAETISESFELEYGTDSLEIHKDAAAKGDKILIVDDLLATGGTAAATAKLITRTGATVEAMTFVIELEFLNGKAVLNNYNIKSLIKY